MSSGISQAGLLICRGDVLAPLPGLRGLPESVTSNRFRRPAGRSVGRELPFCVSTPSCTPPTRQRRDNELANTKQPRSRLFPATAPACNWSFLSAWLVSLNTANTRETNFGLAVLTSYTRLLLLARLCSAPLPTITTRFSLPAG